jgi:hypothetical protein
MFRFGCAAYSGLTVRHAPVFAAFICDCFKDGKKGYKSISGATDQVTPEIQKKGVSNEMRLKLILPVVNPDQYEEPQRCADGKCSGKRFLPWQVVRKNVRDREYEAVSARRYKCLRCGRTFRVYPQGVPTAPQRDGGHAVFVGVELRDHGFDVGSVGSFLE